VGLSLFKNQYIKIAVSALRFLIRQYHPGKMIVLALTPYLEVPA
jgi:hypothetical protein